MKKVIFYLFVIFAVTTSAMSINENSILENKHVLEGQDSIFMPDLNDTFITLTSDTVLIFDTNAHFPDEGIYRAEERYNPFIRDIKFSITYFLKSKSKDVRIVFHCYNFDLNEIKKIRMPVATDTMRVLTLPKEFLERITPLDMNKKFPKIKNKKKAHEFIRNLERKRVWIIDRRYMTDTTVTLVETRIEKVPVGF